MPLEAKPTAYESWLLDVCRRAEIQGRDGPRAAAVAAIDMARGHAARAIGAAIDAGRAVRAAAERCALRRENAARLTDARARALRPVGEDGGTLRPGADRAAVEREYRARGLATELAQADADERQARALVTWSRCLAEVRRRDVALREELHRWGPWLSRPEFAPGYSVEDRTVRHEDGREYVRTVAEQRAAIDDGGELLRW